MLVHSSRQQSNWPQLFGELRRRTWPFPCYETTRRTTAVIPEVRISFLWFWRKSKPLSHQASSVRESKWTRNCKTFEYDLMLISRDVNVCIFLRKYFLQYALWITRPHCQSIKSSTRWSLNSTGPHTLQYCIRNKAMHCISCTTYNLWQSSLWYNLFKLCAKWVDILRYSTSTPICLRKDFIPIIE